MARSLMTEPNEVWLGFLWRQLAREKNLLFYFWRLDDTTVIFPFRFTLCFICFSQPWQFLIVYHIGRKKGEIHLMISNPWDFQNKAKPFLFNLWFVSQNFCLLVFCALDAVRQYWIYLMRILQIGVLVFDQIYDLVYHVIVASYIWMCIHSKKRRVLVLVICFNPQMAV